MLGIEPGDTLFMEMESDRVNELSPSVPEGSRSRCAHVPPRTMSALEPSTRCEVELTRRGLLRLFLEAVEKNDWPADEEDMDHTVDIGAAFLSGLPEIGSYSGLQK